MRLRKVFLGGLIGLVLMAAVMILPVFVSDARAFENRYGKMINVESISNGKLSFKFKISSSESLAVDSSLIANIIRDEQIDASEIKEVEFSGTGDSPVVFQKPFYANGFSQLEKISIDYNYDTTELEEDFLKGVADTVTELAIISDRLEINDKALKDAAALKTVSLSYSVYFDIGQEAFMGCRLLTDLKFLPDRCRYIYDNAFEGIPVENVSTLFMAENVSEYVFGKDGDGNPVVPDSIRAITFDTGRITKGMTQFRKLFPNGEIPEAFMNRLTVSFTGDTKPGEAEDPEGELLYLCSNAMNIIVQDDAAEQEFIQYLKSASVSEEDIQKINSKFVTDEVYDKCKTEGHKFINGKCSVCGCTIEINPFSPVKADSTIEFTYNGSEQPLTTVDSSVGTIVYSFEENGNYSAELPSIKDAGTYDVWYRSQNTAPKCLHVTILPKDITGAEIGAFTPMTYTGASQTPSAEVTIDGLTVTGSWSNVTNVADRSVFTADGSFTGTIESSTGMVKSTPDVPNGPVVEKTSEYGLADGKITGTSEKMEYCTDAAQTTWTPCTGSEISGLAAGTYYIRYKETENSNAGLYATLTVEEGNKNFDITVTNYNGLFDGKAHGITLSGDGLDGATVMYGNEEGVYDKESITFIYTDGCPKTVYFRVTKEGYKEYTGEGTVFIEPVEFSITVTDYYGIFDGNAHGITLSGDGLDGATVMYGNEEGVCDKESITFKSTDGCPETVYFRVTKEGYKEYTGKGTVLIYRPEPVIIPVSEPVVTKPEDNTRTDNVQTDTVQEEADEKASIEQELAGVFNKIGVVVTEQKIGNAVSVTKRNSAYYDENGVKVTDSFVRTQDGSCRYLGSNGKSAKRAVVAAYDAETGEVKMYYAGKNGVIVKDRVVTLPDGSKIYASEDGTLATGAIVTYGSHQYYAGESGKLVKNRVIKLENGNRIFTNKNGFIRKNALITAPDGDMRYATADGTLAKKCWVTVGGMRYWCNSIGRITKTAAVK